MARVAGERVFEDRVEGVLLVCGGDDGRAGLAVAAHLVAVIEAADELDGGLGLVAVQQVERDEGVLKLGDAGAVADAVRAEASEGGGADGDDAVELVGGVCAVVPQVGVGVGAAEGTGVLVGDVDEAGGFGFLEDGFEGGGVFNGSAVVVELAVAVVDGDLVPQADADGVGVGEVGDVVFVERDVRVRVVHDGNGFVVVGVGEGAGGEVVGEAEGVAGLMRGELADALQDHLQGLVVFAGGDFAVLVGGEQGFGDEVVLASAEAAEGDVALEDFAGAWGR